MPKHKKIHRDKNKNGVDDRLDLIAHISAVVLPFTTIDQLYIVFVKKQTDGVSSTTWLLYGLLTIPLLIYSIKRKEVPMIILNGLWVIIDFAVWIGVVMYS